jgi:hypothetical protein
MKRKAKKPSGWPPMKPTPFDPAKDLPPIPFDERHCRMAAALKNAGLFWRPHVGCFVWDRDGHITVPSPFPGRIYFILNLGHFEQLLGSFDDIAAQMIWVPTWHQARLLAEQLGVRENEMAEVFAAGKKLPAGEELLAFYTVILQALKKSA